MSLRLRSGEIHGLVGENGSGKSTLIKMLSGAYQPDGGQDPARAALRSCFPIRAPPARMGVATVFQEFSLVPSLSVAENISSRPPAAKARAGRLARRCATAAARVLADIDAPIDVDATVGDLSVAEQQLVEIAKALAAERLDDHPRRADHRARHRRDRRACTRF